MTNERHNVSVLGAENRREVEDIVPIAPTSSSSDGPSQMLITSICEEMTIVKRRVGEPHLGPAMSSTDDRSAADNSSYRSRSRSLTDSSESYCQSSDGDPDFDPGIRTHSVQQCRRDRSRRGKSRVERDERGRFVSSTTLKSNSNTGKDFATPERVKTKALVSNEAGDIENLLNIGILRSLADRSPMEEMFKDACSATLLREASTSELASEAGRALGVLRLVARRSNTLKGTFVSLMNRAVGSSEAILQTLMVRFAATDGRTDERSNLEAEMNELREENQKLRLENGKLLEEKNAAKLSSVALLSQPVLHQHRKTFAEAAGGSSSASDADTKETPKRGMREKKRRKVGGGHRSGGGQKTPIEGNPDLDESLAFQNMDPEARDKYTQMTQELERLVDARAELDPKGEDHRVVTASIRRLTTARAVIMELGPGKTTPDYTSRVKRARGRMDSSKEYEGQKEAEEQEEGTPLPQPAKARRKEAVVSRPPRSAVVTITCPKDSYKEFMVEARRRIKPADVGIPGALKIRTARTGALLIEVPGFNAGLSADRLAAELGKLAAEKGPGYSIQRPVKTAALRLTGLDATVGDEDVTAAVALAGGCPPTDVPGVELRFTQRGTATAVVRCPLAAASKVAAAGRIVGWTRAGVTALPARAELCFKCMEQGHVR
ncbi:uncharacterized protein LOC112589071 [Harpegnathos saltator]|uniref:uncharacterized protein LOC112589071 n=1 Tax=Harpegnathos saltator TaxID=610380 RepID=UPI000DBEF210|nr:uncharacterized protein LOC112589071 [Harpegnathos saltator]